MKRIVSEIMLTLLLIGMLTWAFNIQPVKASGTIHIRADGTIDPTIAQISSSDNITYTFTGNIYESIVVQRDNIVLEGNGYTLQGFGSGKGIDLTSTYNVTIKNVDISGFYYGVYLYNSSNNVVLSNNITENGWAGVELYSSSNNVISINNIATNSYGIDLDSYGIDPSHSANNTISENKIERNYAKGIRVAASKDINISGNKITANNNDGIWLLYSSNNIIIGNNIAYNRDGIRLDFSSYNSIGRNDIMASEVYGILLVGSPYGNSLGNIISENNITASGYAGVGSCASNNIYHNNIINNAGQAGGVSVWDNGYPSGGNYWSDYSGSDLKSGPYQNETGSDGIGDTPYGVDANNVDRYPLISPYVVPLPLEVEVYPRVLNLLRKGNFTAYMELPVHYNLTDIDTSSLVINETIPVGSIVHMEIGDYDDDTIPDLMVKFNRTAVCEFMLSKGIMTGNVRLTIIGRLNDGTLFEGSDTIRVRMLGDVNFDGEVDMRDIYLAAKAFGSYLGSPRWNEGADEDEDSLIDMKDLTLIAINFGKTYP